MSALTIKRHCYFSSNRPRMWWWKLVDEAGKIVADGFSSKAEARERANKKRGGQ